MSEWRPVRGACAPAGTDCGKPSKWTGLLVGFWKNAWWDDGCVILGLSLDGRLPVTSPGSFVDAPSEGNSEIWVDLLMDGFWSVVFVPSVFYLLCVGDLIEADLWLIRYFKWGPGWCLYRWTYRNSTSHLLDSCFVFDSPPKPTSFLSPPARQHTHILPLYPPFLHRRLPLLSPPSTLSLSLFPWQASDWHLQITRRQWHCVWPLSLISSPPPFCHLITVNPRPAPHCCIFNMPSRPLLSSSLFLTHTFSSIHLQPTLPAPLTNTWRAAVVSVPSRVPPECSLSSASIIASITSPCILLSLECHSIPHTGQSTRQSLCLHSRFHRCH